MGVNQLHKLGYIHRDLKPEVRVACFTAQWEELIIFRGRVTELLGRLDWACQVDGLWAGYGSAEPTEDRVDET